LAGKSALKICLVNKYYPPDKSITAESASDLVRYLLDHGHDVQIVSCRSSYEGGGATGVSIGNHHTVRGSYEGKGKLRRLLGSLLESYRLIKTAISLKADITIVMTSPPMLNLMAAFLFKRKKIRWIYWSMDLYPEAFRANRMVSSQNPLYRYLLKKSYSYPPEFLMPLGEQQAHYLKRMFGKDLPACILPCGIFYHRSEKPVSDIPDWYQDDSKIYFGYIGNLGEAHSLPFLKKLIESLDPEVHRLVLVVYGSKSGALLEFAQAFAERLIIRNFIPREQLGYIDIHLASLHSNWVNVCVPSKLVSAVYGGSSFLFCGPEEGDSWQYLGKAGWLIDPEGSLDDQILHFLKNLTAAALAHRKAEAKNLSEKMKSDIEEAYSCIAKRMLAVGQLRNP